MCFLFKYMCSNVIFIFIYILTFKVTVKWSLICPFFSLPVNCNSSSIVFQRKTLIQFQGPFYWGSKSNLGDRESHSGAARCYQSSSASINVCVVKRDSEVDLYGNRVGVCEMRQETQSSKDSVVSLSCRTQIHPSGQHFILSHTTRSELRSVPDVKHWAVQRLACLLEKKVTRDYTKHNTSAVRS